MKCFIENFLELDLDELLAVNGGYGSSSRNGSGSGSGDGGSGSGSYGAVTSNSRDQTSWDVWVANKDGRNSSGEITRPHDPYKNAPKNSGNYDAPSFVPDNSMTSGPDYIQQQEFSALYGVDFGNTACAATSLLNEISERYLLETGKKMTKEDAINAMKAAVSAGHIGKNNEDKNGVMKYEATINDWGAAANAMADAIGLKGNFSYTTNSSSSKIYAWDKNGDGSADHFVNDIGNGKYYDPWTGKTGDVSELTLAINGLGGTRNLVYSN